MELSDKKRRHAVSAATKRALQAGLAKAYNNIRTLQKKHCLISVTVKKLKRIFNEKEWEVPIKQEGT